MPKGYQKKKKAVRQLEVVAEEIRRCFAAEDAAREKALRLCREIIRFSTNAIRAIHRQEKAEAERLLGSAHLLSQELSPILDEHRNFLHSGFVHDAQKEFVEASAVLSLVNGELPPEPKTLGVSYPAYLNGLGEAVGELRRYLLDSLRRDDLSRCEELLGMMDEIYGILVTMDFPEAITFGLRRTTDMARGVLEKTRADLTLILQQRQLEEKLKAFEEKTL